MKAELAEAITIDAVRAVEFLATETRDGLDGIAQNIERAKGLEFLATETRAGLSDVAKALNNIATAIRERAA